MSIEKLLFIGERFVSSFNLQNTIFALREKAIHNICLIGGATFGTTISKGNLCGLQVVHLELISYGIQNMYIVETAPTL